MSYFLATRDSIRICRPPDLTDEQWNEIKANMADALERAEALPAQREGGEG